MLIKALNLLFITDIYFILFNNFNYIQIYINFYIVIIQYKMEINCKYINLCLIHPQLLSLIYFFVYYNELNKRTKQKSPSRNRALSLNVTYTG